ncbi:MAG: ferrous iron transport protein B [Thermoanaerobaculales bacterium]|nr:ferrous iron transport protein B [Thermoanaerobaculales bacterium]
MKFLLAGQPNSGKSTIFNAIAGYRSATANFPGSSVSYTLSRALIHGREVDVVDLPGMYSLTSSSPEAGEAVHFVAEEDWDLIINVLDASRLERSLELTLQLLQLGRPMVVALNMMDEAERHGMKVDVEALSEELGVPVVATIGRRGQGLKALFRVALQTAHCAAPTGTGCFDKEVATAVAKVRVLLEEAGYKSRIPMALTATKVLELDPHFRAKVLEAAPETEAAIDAIIADLQEVHGWSADQVVSGCRHAMAHTIWEKVGELGRPKVGWRERVDRLLLHPVTGGPLMVVILAGVFFLVFGVGQRLEAPLVAWFDALQAMIEGRFPLETLVGSLLSGIFMGVAGGLTIVLPYLLPFLLALAVLEDSGYLPRMAYILDNLMHRIGLHGKSVLPLILGYGCSVPAIMATRILESRRDRRITAALAAFIPCSARTIVIYGLVAAYLGPLWALGIYVLNLVVIMVIGRVLSRFLEGRSPGLILEIPNLAVPSPETLLAKTWLSLKEFLIIAWPVLVVSSLVLSLLEWAGAGGVVNQALAPLTVWTLGLPVAVGMTLIFGILRKELTLVMLVQALGTNQLDEVMTTVQLVVFTLFVVFYVPCVATVAAMARELGWKDTAWISGLTVVVALVLSLAGRLVFTVI